MRELREFRVHHEEMRHEGLAIAGVTRNEPAAIARWTERLRLPYPVLSDPAGEAGRALGVLRSVGIGAWKIEFHRRTTFLVDRLGTVSAVWRDVKVRGHARQVIAAARGLEQSRP